MIEVTGKMPTVIKNKLGNAGILSDGLITGGNDIDLTFNAKGTETHLAATFVGNGKWVVDEIDDSANLFPQIEEGDSISADMITKLFIDSINSGLHNGYDMEYDYDQYDILSTLSKYADYEQDGLDSVGNTVYKIMWKKLYNENECKDYTEGMEEIYDVNFSEDLSKMYISKDVPKDLFEESNVINSDLILSFNPLGKVKYGIQDVGKAVGRAAKKVGKGIADWAADRLDADQAEKFIRTHGPYRRKYFDTRDDKIKEKKDFRGTNINVGKIEKLPGMGHYKVLTGNPDTQDFQVWHLYRNGAKTRVLDLRTNLQAQEAQWAFDNNIPKSWSPSDWQGDEQQKANEIPLNQVGEEQTQTEEDNVTETKEQASQEENDVQETSQDTQEVEQEEEDNVHDFVEDFYNTKDDEDADAAITNSVDHKKQTPQELVTEIRQLATDVDNLNPLDKLRLVYLIIKFERLCQKEVGEDTDEEVINELKKWLPENVAQVPLLVKLVKNFKNMTKVSKKMVDTMISDDFTKWLEDNDMIKSSVEVEEDNVIDTKKKKSKYNGCNVTGCAQPDGSVVMASIEEDNVYEMISCSLLLSKIEDFQKEIKQYKLEEKPKKVLTEILTRLVKLPQDDRAAITKDSNNNILMLNFGNTDLTTENYIAQFEIYEDEVAAKVNLGKGNSLTGDDAINMCKQTLDSILNPRLNIQ